MQNDETLTNLEETRTHFKGNANWGSETTMGQTSQSAVENVPYGVQRDRERLIENFEQVIEEQVIYYPVCYRFAEDIGRGRQGVVYLAHRQGGRGCLTKHAIKLFDPGIYSAPSVYWTDMGRIASQISVMQQLRSPNLVSMETYDEINGIGYLQMELINGVDLRYLLTGNRMDQVAKITPPLEWKVMKECIFREQNGFRSLQPGVAVYIMRMMLKGLEALHDAGFIHSDIKPSNVMVDQFGYVKIIDYGRAVKPNEKVSILLGSPLYMAPENHRREPATEQSDIYGVGMVGLEILRGKPLVDASHMTEEDLYNFKMDLPNRLYDLLPQYVRENVAFFEVLNKFIAPEPANRYKDVIVAETEQEGLRIVHKQLIADGKDIDYVRLLGSYMSRLCKIRRGEIVVP